MAVKPLLTFFGAPYLDSVIDKPLYHKGRFVIFAAQPVKHKDQQDIKFALFGGDGDITDAMYAEVKEFAAFVKQREAKKKE